MTRRSPFSLGAAAVLPRLFMPDELAAKIEEVMQ